MLFFWKMSYKLDYSCPVVNLLTVISDDNINLSGFPRCFDDLPPANKKCQLLLSLKSQNAFNSVRYKIINGGLESTNMGYPVWWSSLFVILIMCVSYSQPATALRWHAQTKPSISASFQVEAIEKRCLDLFASDYKFSIIHNTNGEVCGHYPRQIVFLEYESTDVERERYASAACPLSSSFSIQSPVHSLTNYPHVCLYRSFDPVHQTVGDKAKVSTDISSSLNRSERRHMRGHASTINWGHFSDFHAIGYSQLIPIDFHSGGFAVRCWRLRQH